VGKLATASKVTKALREEKPKPLFNLLLKHFLLNKESGVMVNYSID